MDASDLGIGNCLKAVKTLNDLSEQEHLVAYGSKKFDSTEQCWNIVEKEAYAIIYAVEKHRHYLIGKKFLLRVDNRVVTYLNSKRTPKSRKLLNWALQLSEYDFEIQHVPSKNNEISDALTRIYAIATLLELQPELSTTEFYTAQQSDQYLSAAFEYLHADQKKFDINRLGPLKRHRKHLNLCATGLLKWKTCIVVPEPLRNRILELCHNNPASGHFGIERTINRFKHKIFWPKALDDVRAWTNGCMKCNQFQPPPGGYVKEPLQPIYTSNRFEIVCFDLAGPFIPKTPRGNQYALILVDHFSKWPEVVALSNADTPTVARAIYDQWCCRYGLMKSLHSDGASNVNGNVIQELCKLLGVNKSHSSRLHPQGDGMAESMAKILKDCIKKQVDKHGSDWDLYIQSAKYSVRSSICTSARFTPSQMILGEILKIPVDLLTTTSPKDLQTPGENYNQWQAQQFLADLGNKLKGTFEEARRSLQVSRAKMKIQYDKITTTHKFKMGDFVMLWYPYKRTGLSKVWQPNWIGPYTIHTLVGPSNCILMDINGNISPIIHCNQLKPVRAPIIHQPIPAQRPPKDCMTQCHLKSKPSVFDELIHDEEEGQDSAPPQHPIIDHGWCNL